MAKISTYTEKTTQIDSEGNISETTIEKTKKIEPSKEPDFVKIYTNMWCEFNQIPMAHRPLFLELVGRMTYCNKDDLANSQIVFTGEPVSSALCKTLGWKTKDSLMKGLKALCTCDAIKKIARGVYQINPSYAGRGEWKYNPTLGRGGIEDLVATFHFKDHKVDTKIVWADDGDDTEINTLMRSGIGCRASEKTVMTETTVSA